MALFIHRDKLNGTSLIFIFNPRPYVQCVFSLTKNRCCGVAKCTNTCRWDFCVSASAYEKAPPINDLALGTFKIPIYKYEKRKKSLGIPISPRQIDCLCTEKTTLPTSPPLNPPSLEFMFHVAHHLPQILAFFHGSNASTSTATATPAALTEQSSALAVMTLLPRVASCFPWCEITTVQ